VVAAAPAEEVQVAASSLSLEIHEPELLERLIPAAAGVGALMVLLEVQVVLVL
jgi:hypothetical protein